VGINKVRNKSESNKKINAVNVCYRQARTDGIKHRKSVD
jgi:hypothetical protein